LVVGLEGLRTGVALSQTEADYKNLPLSRSTDVAFGAGFMALYAASAVYGFYQVNRCQEAHAEYERPRGLLPPLRRSAVARPASRGVSPALPVASGPPTPGGVEPLSPERVAHIAPFTKRHFASPAECEAACPTGKCLPYRAEQGAAMACIVRCKVDSECPQGLACNCPATGGPGCRSIAQVPGDPMDGICLSVEPDGERR
jgi:hypothetical protein